MVCDFVSRLCVFAWLFIGVCGVRGLEGRMWGLENIGLLSQVVIKTAVPGKKNHENRGWHVGRHF